uniref:Uncharacterized protein n=1 Tax=Anopheles minimus TaxID=112268 RepID=A0A182VYU6_9DIPT
MLQCFMLSDTRGLYRWSFVNCGRQQAHALRKDNGADNGQAATANNAKVNFREKEKKILDQILGAGKYDARIRPSGINGTGTFNHSITLAVSEL